MMNEDDDNITEVQDDRKQNITENFQKESDNAGTKPDTPPDRDKVLPSTVMRKNQLINNKRRL